MKNTSEHPVRTFHLTERLSIHDLVFNDTKSECIYRLQEQLSMLSFKMLLGVAEIEKLIIIGDEGITEFSGDIFDEDTVEAIRCLDDNTDLDFVLQCQWRWTADYPSISVDTDKIVDALSRAGDGIYDNIFFAYQLISSPETEFDEPQPEELVGDSCRIFNVLDDPGVCCVYGELDGSLIKGELAPVKVSELPDSESWGCFPDIVSLSDTDVNGDNGERIKELCDMLSELTCSDDPYELDDDGILCFSPYSFDLSDAESIKTFASCVSELNLLCRSNGKLRLMPRFWDLGDKLRMLYIDFNEDGSYETRISAIPGISVEE